jgi:tetratricopeptide (TPR) repeat protein
MLYPEALATFNKALALDPTSIPVRKNIALTYLNNKQYKEAAEVTTQLVQVAPTDPEVFLFHAYALAQTGKLQEAKDAADKVVALKPSAELLAQAKSLLGNLERAGVR